MKKTILFSIQFLFIAAFLLSGPEALAYHQVVHKKVVSPAKKELAEGCMPPSAYAFLDINNVRARIMNGGDLWWDLQGAANYFIPQNTYQTAFFAGALWIGGLDDNGNLRLAAQRFRGEGVDFWPGPLTNDGTDTTYQSTCGSYDRLWVLYRKEVEQFIHAYQTDPTLSGYQVPDFIKDYPAHGDPAKNQSFYLAPFYDADHNGVYDYTRGDYPYYDFNNELCQRDPPCGAPMVPTMEGNGNLADQVLKGDQTIWWVFNDKGGVHGESKGGSLGIEVRAQAFAFATNDEINDMTFYSYEIINRSTNRIKQTWLGFFADVDLGDAWDDYVGCDVKRGLGYVYNGRDPDGTGKPQDYGAQPPAAGIDFFQGPYMDPDGMDNPRFDINGELICDVGINGANFGDCIIDNERYGMNKFVFFNGIGGYEPMTVPDIAPDYYNFLRGIWKDGQHLTYWGNANPNAGGTGPECSFMFPWDSDPCNWGTNGIDPGPGIWNEPSAGNQPYDRRFMMSSGPFTMEPGEVNYLTFGVPWARANSGGPLGSVEKLKMADDKAQQFFDNCFQVLDGPNAPDLTIQELDRELILYISNRPHVSSNYSENPEDFAVTDPSIVFPDTLPADHRTDSVYRFEGYQIFQMVDASVTIDDLHNPDKARLVAQCDIRNGVGTLVNYYYDETINGLAPVLEVEGSDAGIVHSFRIFDDAFATGDKRLVNHRQYYYMAVAYAHNNYKTYSSLNPLSYDGQKCPYLLGKHTAMGGALVVQTGIPHIPSPEAGGTITHAEYGVQPMITRIEGQGNGGLVLDLTQASIDKILADGHIDNPEYKYNKGPVNIKVIDPLNVTGANFSLQFVPHFTSFFNTMGDCTWKLTNLDNGAEWNSETAISAGYEQLLMDIGLSIQIEQPLAPIDSKTVNLGFLEATMDFADSTNKWLYGFNDDDSDPLLNWIRSGTVEDPNDYANSDYMVSLNQWLDPEEVYENVLGGSWTSFALASRYENGPAYSVQSVYITKPELLARLASVDLYITADKSKWSRCPVFELSEDNVLSEGGVNKLDLRAGSTDGEQGMGWFPGYAINLETGERLNIAFGEDSGIPAENGRDMIWNPTGSLKSGNGDVLMGGKHFIYIFGHNRDSINSVYGSIDCPAYDGGQWIKETMQILTNHDRYRSFIFKDAMWVGAPATIFEGSWNPENIPCEVKIRLRVEKPYNRFYSTKHFGSANPENNDYPLYHFSTDKIAVNTSNNTAATGALDLINVVPNPYFAWSGYETSTTDNRVRIVNLPEHCTISIYSVNGTLIRQLVKDDAMTSMDWDLKNNNGIPIAGGLYIFYIKVDGVGEKVVKWFGATQPDALNVY